MAKSSYEKGREKCKEFADAIFDLRTALTDTFEILDAWFSGIPPAETPRRAKQEEEIVLPCLDHYANLFAEAVGEAIYRRRLKKYWRPYVEKIAYHMVMALYFEYDKRTILRITGYSESTYNVTVWLLRRIGVEIPEVLL